MWLRSIARGPACSLLLVRGSIFLAISNYIHSSPIPILNGVRSISPIALNPLNDTSSSSDSPTTMIINTTPANSSANLTARRFTCPEYADYPDYTTYLGNFLPAPQYDAKTTSLFASAAIKDLRQKMGGDKPPGKDVRKQWVVPGGRFIFTALYSTDSEAIREASPKPGTGKDVHSVSVELDQAGENDDAQGDQSQQTALQLMTFGAGLNALSCLKDYAESASVSTIGLEYCQPLSIITTAIEGGQVIHGRFGPM